MLSLSHCPHCHSKRVFRSGFSAPIPSFILRKRAVLKCKDCGRRFRVHYYSFHFGLKKSDPGLNAKIFRYCLEGLSNRAIGRLLYVSEHLVRIRIDRLARQALSFHASMTKDFGIREPLCFDGLENFAGSQYDVNNIQQAIGRDSLFIYDFNYASLNRKGRMSDWQKLRLREIETDFGRYNPKSIRVATFTLLQRLYEKRASLAEPLTLVSDEHFQYRRVVQQDLRKLRIDHLTISSKACRNFQNILFPVNHADLLIRQQVKAFARETISFSKTPGAQCQKYALFMTFKNYMTPQFTKKHVRRPNAHEKSPAQELGLTKGLLEFYEIFYKRPLASDLSNLNDEWKCFWHGEIPAGHQRQPKFVRCRVRPTS
jgi:transposase-like protein